MLDFSISNKLTDDIIINNDLTFVLQQIDLLFDTDLGAVLGNPTFGTNYDKYLYTLGMSNAALEQKILNDLHTLDLRGFTVDVKVTIMEGTYRDIALINITLSGDYSNYEKTYVIK